MKATELPHTLSVVPCRALTVRHRRYSFVVRALSRCSTFETVVPRWRAR